MQKTFNSQTERDRNMAISEALLEDKGLQSLYAERAKIHSFSTPTVVIDKKGKAEIVYLTNETLKPFLEKVEALIEHRTNQIKGFFNR